MMKHKLFLFILGILIISGCSGLNRRELGDENRMLKGEGLSQKIEKMIVKTKIKANEREEKRISAATASPVKQVLGPRPKQSSEKKMRPILSKKLKKYCKKIQGSFRKWGWGYSKCQNFPWHHVRSSILGTPLIWMTFGNETPLKDSTGKLSKNVTMIFCGVHGDEITPIKFCFDIIYYLDKNPTLYEKRTIVVAPIVNPDSFFKKYPTRTNHRKVDVNRNFPTKDWKKMAHKLWRGRYKKDRRRFPGNRPLSEAEAIFQVNLIKRYGPDKIISVHAPLTLIDYDGPVKKGKSSHFFQNQLLITMSEKADGYKVKDYPFFPGSLGNWAGNERKIPTYTLELPSSDNRKHKKFWKIFKRAIHAAIVHDGPTKSPEVAKSEEESFDSI